MREGRRAPSLIERVAYHEAGHAVAAYILRRRLERVEVGRQGNSLGRTKYAPLPRAFRPTRQRLERAIMVALAGMAAERVTYGLYNLAASGEFHEAINLAKGDGEWVRGLLARTEELLRSPAHRAAMEALAAELVKRRQVGARRARAIIREAMEQYAMPTDDGRRITK